MSESVTSTILPTENQDWSFWGTMREHAAEAWPIAFTAIHNATSTDPASVRAFLDSRYGRHFADGVNGQMYYGASLADAIAKTTAEWMGWRITQRTSCETGMSRVPHCTACKSVAGSASWEAPDDDDGQRATMGEFRLLGAHIVIIGRTGSSVKHRASYPLGCANEIDDIDQSELVLGLASCSRASVA